jgi:hypothetical protein
MERHYILNTTFYDNDKLKKLSCRWCPEEKLWYCFNTNLNEVKKEFTNIFYTHDETTLNEKNKYQNDYITDIILKCNELNIHRISDNIIFNNEYYKTYYNFINEVLDYLTFCKYTKIKEKISKVHDGGRTVLSKKYHGQFTLDQKKIWRKIFKYYKLPSFIDIIDNCVKITNEKYVSINGWKTANINSKIQEGFWKQKLLNLYPKINYQYKKDNCVFDFIDYENKIIFEVKLNYCDVIFSQFYKYKQMYPEFKIVYLIGIDKVSYIKFFSEYYYNKLLNEYHNKYDIYKNNNCNNDYESQPMFPKKYSIFYEFNLIQYEDLYENINYYNKNFEDIIEILKKQCKLSKIHDIKKCEYV